MDNNDAPKPPPSTLGDAPDKEKMDQIRQRRLEKLSAPKPAEETALPSGSSTPAGSSSPKPSSSSSTPQPAAQNPFTKLGVSAAPVQSQPAKIATPDSSAKRGRTTTDESSPAAAPPRKTATPAKEETLEEFEQRVLSQIFRITLDPHRSTDSSGHKLTFLIDLHQELSEASEPLRLSVGNLDSALSEAASKIPHSKPVLDYLIPCWKRIGVVAKALRGNVPEKAAVLKEARRLCLSYASFAVTMPEFFGRDANVHTDSLTPYLILDSDNEKGIDHSFLTEAAARFEEDEMIKPMITKAVAGLSLQLSSLHMNDNYKPYVMALKVISMFPVFLTAIAEDPLFQMATSALGIEKHTILGPFFRISPLQAEVTKVFFAGPKTMDKTHIKTSQTALRVTLNNHQQDLLDIINGFVRASTTARNRTLDWFAYIVNSNHKRGAMRVDEKLVSSDGFMANVAAVLEGLCVPFMDSTFSKISKVDVDYLRRSPRVDIKEETKINADQNESDAFYAKPAEGTSNFISEVFFLSLAAHHYGTVAIHNKLKNLEKDIQYFNKQIRLMEAERPKFLNNPRQMAVFEMNLKRYNDILEKAMSLKMTIEGVIFDEQMQGRSILFMRYVIVWILRIATGTDYVPSKKLTLPLPAQQPEVYKCLPEYILEDIADHFKFIFRTAPHVITSTQTDELVTFCIVFLNNSDYIKNPGVKSGMISILYFGIWPSYHRQRGVLGDALLGDKFANDHLLHALIKYFIEAESTGTSSQFYDKFNIRYEIFQVIKCIWANDVYKQRLTQESKQNTAFFVRFVNLLLNDATYVLDESLTKFPKIHNLQVELKNPGALTPEEKSAKEEELQQAENQATSYMQLANETMAMMKLFTAALGESFTMPEIVQRLADMLDLNLDTLVGPKSTNLKVENPEKYHFNPRQLLAELIDIYLNLGKWEPFVQAVARDGRSYRPEIFDSATQIVTRLSLKSPEELEGWQDLKQRIQKAKEQDEQDEEDLGEIPDELQDPIMSGLMEDPVILPHSKITLDRSTITAHLLNDPKDPFNRQPMTIEDVIPDTAMKERIRLFKEERKAAKRAATAEAMDTTE